MKEASSAVLVVGRRTPARRDRTFADPAEVDRLASGQFAGHRHAFFGTCCARAAGATGAGVNGGASGAMYRRLVEVGSPPKILLQVRPISATSISRAGPVSLSRSRFSVEKAAVASTRRRRSRCRPRPGQVALLLAAAEHRAEAVLDLHLLQGSSPSPEMTKPFASSRAGFPRERPRDILLPPTGTPACLPRALTVRRHRCFQRSVACGSARPSFNQAAGEALDAAFRKGARTADGRPRTNPGDNLVQAPGRMTGPVGRGLQRRAPRPKGAELTSSAR